MPYNDTATIIVKTYTAGGALPVSKTVVKINGADEENRFVEYTILTDVDGITPKIPLPAPNKSESLSPGAKEFPYALYDIEVTADGYYPKRINNVALFSGVETFQPINMIPISVYESGVDFPRDTLNSTVYENPYL